MVIQGFYKLSERYVDLIENLGGKYGDRKQRPIYCCIRDSKNENIYWAIPTSDISHRTAEQIKKIKKFCSLPQRDLRSCFYHIGHSDRECIFKISNALPVTEDYLNAEYTSQDRHLILKDKKLISEIERKLKRILLTEDKKPNYFEQHITDIYNALVIELEASHNLRELELEI